MDIYDRQVDVRQDILTGSSVDTETNYPVHSYLNRQTSVTRQEVGTLVSTNWVGALTWKLLPFQSGGVGLGQYATLPWWGVTSSGSDTVARPGPREQL